MASVGNDRNGRKRLLFVGRDGKRRTVRLGKASAKQAEAVKVKVESLVTAQLSGSMDDETARWVAGLDDGMHAKLAAVGLVTPRHSARLGPFLDGYIASRCDVKPATVTNWRHTRRGLLEHFGADKPLREITQGDADRWRLYLIGQGLAANTVRKRCGNAKQFFRAAVRSKLVSENPFADLPAVTKGNAARMFFITREMAEKVLDACPDAQWRLVFSLCRYGGLRMPSEVFRLTWADVDWAGMKLILHSSKTEHHDGGGVRRVPIFPELYPHLMEAFEQAEPGTEHVITILRDGSGASFRTLLARVIKRAGLVPWPKLFQNLRSTRETELAERWPEHVVCAWMGNSPAVARKHYLQVTEEHFEQAAMRTESGTRAAQNPAQQPAASSRTVSQAIEGVTRIPAETLGNCNALREVANTCDGVKSRGLGDTGLEPVTSRV